MTAPASWPGLGFDPAPGDPVGAAALVEQLTSGARYLRETHDVLAGVRDQRGTWTGEASRAFAERIDVLPRYLDAAQASMRRAGDVLDGWAERLGGFQTRARDLEGTAVTTRRDLAAAEETEQRAAAHPDFGLIGLVFPETELPGVGRRVRLAQAALDDATATVQRLRSSLEDLLRRAEVLRTEHGEEARRTADGVRGADDGLAPPEPGWFDQAVDWAGDHLGDIGDALGLVSTVATVLAFTPLAPIAAPIALATAAGSLLAHGTDIAVNDKWTDPGAWADLGADVVGLIPGGRILGRAAVDGAEFSFRTSDGLGPMVSAAVEAPARFALPRVLADVQQPGAVFMQVGELSAAVGGGSAEVIAKTAHGGFEVATQLPTLAEWASPGQTHQEEKFAASTADAVASASDIAPQGLDRLVRALS